MNYIFQIKMFYDWLETNPISDSAINLWHALMHMNNKALWKQEFTVAISTLELKTSLSKSSILRARNTLQQSGRIVFKSRNGQQSAIYSIVAFHGGAQSEAETVTQTGPQTGPQTGSQTVPISNTKLNLDETKPIIAGAGTRQPAKKKKNDYSKTEFWQSFVDAWDKFYFGKFNERYNYLDKDFGCLKKIYDFLKKRAEARQFEWSEKVMIEGFYYFLGQAWVKDNWVASNFTIPILLSQFNQIANARKQELAGKGTGGRGGSIDNLQAHKRSTD